MKRCPFMRSIPEMGGKEGCLQSVWQSVLQDHATCDRAIRVSGVRL